MQMLLTEAEHQLRLYFCQFIALHIELASRSRCAIVLPAKVSDCCIGL